MAVQNLGQIGVFFKGTSPPSNTDLVWLDTTSSPAVFKVYDSTQSAWVNQAGGGSSSGGSGNINVSDGAAGFNSTSLSITGGSNIASTGTSVGFADDIAPVVIGGENIGQPNIGWGVAYLSEKASIGSVPSAAHGGIWVRNDTPNTLMFTDDAGTDFPIVGDILDGTHVPTVTSVLNVDSSTANNSRYYRIGNSVTVYGNVLIDPTSTGSTEFRLSLPVSSNFSNPYDASGTFTASVGGNYDAGVILADSTNDEVRFLWNASSSSNNTLYYHYSYFVI